MSEAVYLRKPMLALPLTGQFEQGMNARYLERSDTAPAATALDEPALEQFLERDRVGRDRAPGLQQDGNSRALATMEQVIEESWRRRRLTRTGAEGRSSCSPGRLAWAASRSRSRAATGWAERCPPGFSSAAVGHGVRHGDGPPAADRVPRLRFTSPCPAPPAFVAACPLEPGGELMVFATYFALAVVWDYCGSCSIPAYTVRRFRSGATSGGSSAVDLAVPARLLPRDRPLGRPGGPGDMGGGHADLLRQPAVDARRAGRPDRAHGASPLPLPPLVPADAPRRGRRPRDHPHALSAGPQEVRSAESPTCTRWETPKLETKTEGSVKKWPVAAAGAARGRGRRGRTTTDRRRRPRASGQTFVGTPGEGNLLALTYDDGPNTAWTPQLLELLEKHGARPRSSPSGSYAEQEPELLRQVADAGHAIGNHT